MAIRRHGSNYGFTIIELIVVIVVIGILAAISYVSYSGVRKQAIIASLQSDLDSASRQLEMYQVEKDGYPVTIDCGVAGNTFCIEVSDGNRISFYRAVNDTTPKYYLLTISNGTLNYSRTSQTGVFADTSFSGIMSTDPANPLASPTRCPIGYIIVPGSATYETSDFCVMKYEAKTASVGVAPSTRPEFLPLFNIQSARSAVSKVTVAKYTVISENEWLTIANNVYGVASNWSNGVVGSGYIFSGNNDGSSTSSLSASSDDTDGYFGTGDFSGDMDMYSSSGMVGDSQRRTLTLSNGEVIWDFAGNVWEFTSGQISSQPGVNGTSSYAFREWDDKDFLNNGLPFNAVPPNSDGINGNSSVLGLGKLYTNVTISTTNSFMRGGCFSDKSAAGIYSLRNDFLYASSSYPTNRSGFRASYHP